MWLHSSVGRASHRYCGGHGFEVEALIFFRLLHSNCLNWKFTAKITYHLPTLFCSHGTNNARGVAILIRNNFDCKVEESVIDTNSRFIILRVLLSGEPALLVNIYGPNRDNELVAFYRSILQTIVNKKFDEIENIIMGGDFNCPLNPVIDKRGGNLTPRQSVINAIE